MEVVGYDSFFDSNFPMSPSISESNESILDKESSLVNDGKLARDY